MTTQEVCRCGASRFPGAQCIDGCPGLHGTPYAQPSQPSATPGRRRVEAEYTEGRKSLRIKFMPGLPQPYDSQLDEEGQPIERTVGSIIGTMMGYRNAQTSMGTAWFLDLELPDGTEAGVLCTTRLQQLIPQCSVGQKLEIVRLPDRGRMHDYDVFILD